jgi:hypothetical protein
MALAEFASRIDSEAFDRGVMVFQRELDASMKRSVMAAARFGAQRSKVYAAPSRTGRLVSRIDYRSGPTSQNSVSAIYGPVNVPYARFVEYDTKPHPIVAHPGNRANGMLVFWMNGRKIVVRSVSHPGTTGKRFLGRTVPEVRGHLTSSLNFAIRTGAGRAFL